MRQASQERSKSFQTEQSAYQGVSDLPSLLQQLSLEHYADCFEKEEVDLSTFLTMTEPDLKEIGVNTLGARRKLQIAIAGAIEQKVGILTLNSIIKLTNYSVIFG